MWNKVRNRLRLFFALTITLPVCSIPSANASLQLSLVEGNLRILVACPSDQYAIERISPTMDWEGFYERDLELVTISEEFPNIYLTYFVDGNVLRDPLVGEYVERIVKRSKCDQKTSFVLIGKDGGVKRRWTDQLSITDLFQTIDAMPMRRFEMRQRGED